MAEIIKIIVGAEDGNITKIVKSIVGTKNVKETVFVDESKKRYRTNKIKKTRQNLHIFNRVSDIHPFPFNHAEL